MKKLLMLVLCAGALWASGRNINGATGYIVIPNAEGLRFQQYNFGLGAFSGTNEMKSHWKYDLALGTSDGSELGVMGRSEREGLFLNLKWFGALNNYENPLHVAIGFENLSSMGTFQDYPAMYMVSTKKFLGGHSVSVGFIGRYVAKEVITSAMLGGEIFTDEHLSWVADAAAYEDNKYNLNAGLRVYTSDTMYFNFTLVNLLRNDKKTLNADGDEIDAHPFYGTIGMTITNFM
ncbi:MAG: hypothetical protein LBD99_01850 [Candidatus Margulisbacteria bacterium]|nr:hypothetical protein [Candidatus Margulisiibacteriota bacterium]